MRSCYKLYRVMAFSFDNLPINPLVGADSATFDRVTSGVEIDHLARFRATKICQRVLNPLYQVNNRIYDRANLQKIVSPLFILGHWRSGTTLLHNLLAEDAQFCYCAVLLLHNLSDNISPFDDSRKLCYAPFSCPCDAALTAQGPPM